jgi:hypothetical protein
VKTYADCVKKAKKIGIPAKKIARAFGIITGDDLPLKMRLEAATTQNKRWSVYNDSPVTGGIREEALKIILDNATSQEERYKVYNNAPSGSEVERIAMLVILDNATTQEERRRMYAHTADGSDLEKAAIRALCS